MAVTGLTIYKDNIEGSINTMAVHSPLIFLIDLTYTEVAPDKMYCEILIGTTSVLTVRCIYASDVSSGTRRFKFVADEILRSLLPLFDDYVQSGQSFEIAKNLSQEFQLVFKDDLVNTHADSCFIDAVHAARQVGESACMTDICANASGIYIGAPNKPVYVYFYNKASGVIPPEPTDYALDYNGDIFTDYNGDRFTIQ
jgi:hypothetical protein